MSDLDKLTVPALKKKCKECGVAQTGEKPDLLNRLKLHAKGEAAKLDGVNPSNLKAGELKKALAHVACRVRSTSRAAMYSWND